MRLTATAARLVAIALAASAAACGAKPAAAPAAGAVAPLVGEGAPLRFTFDDADPARPPLDAAKLRGKPLVLALLTTYDMASQAQAKFLAISIARRQGAVRAAAILLDPIENRPLAPAFREALRLEYQVAVADAATIAGRGPFGALHSVPALIVLDADGRVAWKKAGLTKDVEIDEILDRLR